ncbi:hypothetical protein AAG906_017595 [Vitis piasezkii]
MLRANAISTPISYTMSFKLHGGALQLIPLNIVKSLVLYTSPSLNLTYFSFCVNKLSRFMHHSSTAHWFAIKGLFSISKALFILAYFFASTHHSLSMPLQTLIGQETLMIALPHQLMLCFLV